MIENFVDIGMKLPCKFSVTVDRKYKAGVCGSIVAILSYLKLIPILTSLEPAALQ